MIEVFRESGFPVDTRSAPGVITIELPTSLSADAIARFEEREHIAAVAAVRSVLEPLSVAVICAEADLTLTLPDGQGVAELLRGPVVRGRARVHPRRWQLTLGTGEDGEPVTLPAQS